MEFSRGSKFGSKLIRKLAKIQHSCGLQPNRHVLHRQVSPPPSQRAVDTPGHRRRRAGLRIRILCAAGAPMMAMGPLRAADDEW